MIPMFLILTLLRANNVVVVAIVPGSSGISIKISSKESGVYQNILTHRESATVMRQLTVLLP